MADAMIPTEQTQSAVNPSHAVKVDIAWAGSGRDGDPWLMTSWAVKWCDCDRPWRHEALA